MNRAIIEQVTNPYIGVFLASSHNLSNPKIQEIVNAVIRITKVSRDDLFARRDRRNNVVMARGFAYKIIRQYIPLMSLKQIGEYFNGYDHTTIIHNLASVSNRIETEYVVSELYEKVLNEIKYRKLKEA